tara:strand:+ start:2737 stop:3396 length:660 start_codon:yes stop_codon:yes gene_type:complete
MGYLNNSIITVDAILTTKGRELLAKQDGSFAITQFALGDDEIDYTLYNPSHPSGSAFYGEAIEKMPLLEAFPDQNQIMKYKLVTLPRGTAKMPIIAIDKTAIIVKQNQTFNIDPSTMNYLGNNITKESSGYTFTISDNRLTSLFEGIGLTTTQAATMNATTTIGTNVSKTVVGTQLNGRGTGTNNLWGGKTSLQATIVVIGRDSGARVMLPFTLKYVKQ